MSILHWIQSTSLRLILEHHDCLTDIINIVNVQLLTAHCSDSQVINDRALLSNTIHFYQPKYIAFHPYTLLSPHDFSYLVFLVIVILK